LPASVAEVLAEHLRVVGPGDRGLVFSGEIRQPLTPSTLHSAFAGACRRAGVETTFHQLRHFTASALIAAGCSVKGVQSYLGHAKASETLDTYSHLWPSDEDRIRGAVDAVLSQQDPARSAARPSSERQARTGTTSGD
jgi:integrase